LSDTFEIKMERYAGGIHVSLDGRRLHTFPDKDGVTSEALAAGVGVYVIGMMSGIKAVQSLMDRRSDRDAAVVIIGGGLDEQRF